MIHPLRVINGGRPDVGNDGPVAGKGVATIDEREDDRAASAVIAVVCFGSMVLILVIVYLLGMVAGLAR